MGKKGKREFQIGIHGECLGRHSQKVVYNETEGADGVHIINHKLFSIISIIPFTYLSYFVFSATEI